MLERRACCYGALTKVFLGGSFACLVWAKSESQVWTWDLNPPTQLNAIDSSTGERADKRRVQSFMGYKKQTVVYLLQVVTCFYPPNWHFPLSDSQDISLFLHEISLPLEISVHKSLSLFNFKEKKFRMTRVGYDLRGSALQCITLTSTPPKICWQWMVWSPGTKGGLGTRKISRRNTASLITLRNYQPKKLTFYANGVTGRVVSREPLPFPCPRHL